MVNATFNDSKSVDYELMLRRQKNTLIPRQFEINLDKGFGHTCSFSTHLAYNLATQGLSTTARNTSQHGGEDHEPR